MRQVAFNVVGLGLKGTSTAADAAGRRAAAVCSAEIRWLDSVMQLLCSVTVHVILLTCHLTAHVI
jgi:hypothetical protein